MNTRVACQYMVNSPQQRCNQRLAEVRSIYGEIRPFNAKESKQVITRGKSVFRKGKTHAFRGLWVHYNVPL